LHGTEPLDKTYTIAQSEALIRGEGQAIIYWGNSLIPHDPQNRDPADQFLDADLANHFD
jgi:hypothetical protein